jgi:tetratricopeptide (TPR) repeat protein
MLPICVIRVICGLLCLLCFPVVPFVFGSPPQAGEVALRQIVLASEQEAGEARARLIAGASFEALAAERSRDATARRGGYLGRIRLSDLQIEVRKALEPVQPGEVSNPVRVGNTYVLFQIVPEAEGRWIDLDEAGAEALADGRNTEAATHFEQALAHAETAALGDARLARSLDTLAAVYRLEGRAVEAEKLYRRALALLERMGAPELEIAQVLSGLGKALVKQARFTEAQPLYERARSIRENRLGPDHPEVAATLHNVAELFAGLGRFAEAANLYEQAQALLERTLGAGHPATVAGAESLQAFRRSLMPELLDRFSKAISLSEFRDGEFARTIIEIRELLPLAPLSEYSFVQMKDILLEVGLSNETEGILRAGLTKFPQSRILHIYLADLLAETGRTQNALGVLEETYRLPRPEGVDEARDRQQQAIVQQRIGDMQSALNNLDGAVAAYRRSLEVDPAAPAGRVKLGKAYFSSNRLEDALAEFERAIGETPDNSEAHLRLSETHLAGGQWERAAEAAERAIERGASDPRALYLLGTALVRMGRREQGQERLKEFARVEADFLAAKGRDREIDAINIAAIGALREADGNAALKRLADGIMQYPDAGRLQMNLAMVQSRLGRHQMAIETLESMLERGIGRRFLIHKNLGDEYEILGNTEASRRHRKIYLDTREAELMVNEHK